MNKEQAYEVWGRCMEVFHSNVTEPQFQTWFSYMKFKSYDAAEKALTVYIPSQFYFEYLEEHFRRLIHLTINQEYGQDVTLQYEIEIADKGTVTQESESTLPVQEQAQKTGKTKSTASDLDSQLNEKYNFGNFVEGNCNKLPCSIGLSIAERPDQTLFTPLFIYGPSGVGKTHLVNAIGLKTKERHPEMRVLYVTAHLFLVQFTESRRTNSFNDFIHFYQSIDLLIVDDVQELIGMTATQNAFFHIFNHLKQNGKNIILTCDRPPVSLQGMEERIVTRFKSGLMAEMTKPEENVRRSILRNYIKHDGLNIPEPVVDYISKNVSSSVRDLEGVIHTLLAYSVVYNQEVDLEFAQRVLKHSIRPEKKEITIDNIITACCEYYNVKEEDIFGKSRKAQIAMVRHVCMYLTNVHTKMSSSKIGCYLGGRDHATIIHGVRAIKTRLAVDKELQSDIEEIEKRLTSQSL